MIKRIFRNFILWLYFKFHSFGIALGVALFNTESEMLKGGLSGGDERNNHTQRMRSRNQLLEKFYAGKTDEKYVQEYYEVLKKADKFIRTATPHQMAVAADKYGTSYGIKDKYGRRYEHYGFFDDKHKNAGKTIGEVLVEEIEERRTKDDDLEIVYIFNNTPIEVGLTGVGDFLGKKTKGKDLIVNINEGYDAIKYPTTHLRLEDLGETELREVPEYITKICFKRDAIDIVDINKISKQFRFPIEVIRESGETVNRIEELTEFLHVKKIGFEYRQLEFFIPLKYKTSEIKEESKVFKEIVDIQQVFIRDDYGELTGFTINNYVKRINYNDTHEVLKFDGIEMENMGINN